MFFLLLIIRNGLENVKQIIEQRVTSDNDIESLTFEKKQYELLLSQYEFCIRFIIFQIFCLVMIMN